MIAILVSAAVLVSVVVFLWMPVAPRRTFEHDVKRAPRCLTCAHPSHRDACTYCGCIWPHTHLNNSRESVECGDCHHVHRGRMYCNYRGLCTCTFIPGNSRADHG